MTGEFQLGSHDEMFKAELVLVGLFGRDSQYFGLHGGQLLVVSGEGQDGTVVILVGNGGRLPIQDPKCDDSGKDNGEEEESDALRSSFSLTRVVEFPTVLTEDLCW